MAPRERKPHLVQCRECGSPTMTTGSWDTCQECKDLKANTRNVNDIRIREDLYYVVDDPNKEYGYDAGSSFYQREINCMIRQCNHALSVGMILRRRDELFKVIQHVNGKQELEKI